MANLQVSGFDDLTKDFSALSELPESVVNDMLNAEADILVAEQRKTAEEMFRGRGYETGTTARSIKKGGIKRSGNDRVISIGPIGSNARGGRNAAVAFINEYGKKRQPARPAIRTANERAGDRAVEAAENVLNTYLDQRKL